MRTQDFEPEIDPYLCHCGPCQQFWKENFSSENGSNHLRTAPTDRAKDTSMMHAIAQKKENHPAILRIGDRAVVKGRHKGVVKYVGILDDHLIAPHCYVGIQLDEQVNSRHNGVYKGKRYFHCPRGHGAFVKYCEAVKINPAEKRPAVTGNPMYPNYKEMLERRKDRAKIEPTMATWGPPYSKPVVITVFDKNDIAAKDQEKSVQNKKYQTKSKEEEVNREDILKWKQKFGGDERAEAMANTLRRLQLAHNKGKLYECEDTPAPITAHDRKHRQSVSYLSRRVSTVR